MAKLGDFECYKQIDFSQVQRLVFVCAGNICRSPLAEAIALKSGITSISYGLACRGGDPADPRAINYAMQHDLDLGQHITKNIEDYSYQTGDLLVGMEPLHVKALEDRFNSGALITLIGLWLPKSKAYIHDPYNANPIFFNRCEDEITSATLALVEKLRG